MATEIKSARDALEKIEKLAHCDLCNVYPKHRAKYDAKIGGIERIAKAALALPRRNCDMGTPDEQAKRFEDFCLKHIGCAEETGGMHCVGCPLEKASRNITQKCELYWAQMPYEKGADE